MRCHRKSIFCSEYQIFLNCPVTRLWLHERILEVSLTYRIKCDVHFCNRVLNWGLFELVNTYQRNYFAHLWTYTSTTVILKDSEKSLHGTFLHVTAVLSVCRLLPLKENLLRDWKFQPLHNFLALSFTYSFCISIVAACSMQNYSGKTTNIIWYRLRKAWMHQQTVLRKVNNCFVRAWFQSNRIESNRIQGESRRIDSNWNVRSLRQNGNFFWKLKWIIFLSII